MDAPEKERGAAACPAGASSQLKHNSTPVNNKSGDAAQVRKPWRDRLRVHPAAEMLPLMNAEELRELADDIGKTGLRHGIDLYIVGGACRDVHVLDGRNRLDALELLGLNVFDGNGGLRQEYKGLVVSEAASPRFDPFAFVISKNVRRRHLNAEQKRDLLAKLLKAQPDSSDRKIAKTAGVDGKTVAAVRKGLEATAEIPQLTQTKGSDGKARPSRRAKPKATKAPSQIELGADAVSVGAPTPPTRAITHVPPPPAPTLLPEATTAPAPTESVVPPEATPALSAVATETASSPKSIPGSVVVAREWVATWIRERCRSAEDYNAILDFLRRAEFGVDPDILAAPWTPPTPEASS